MQMNNFQKGYIAGMIDGDGWIGIKDHRKIIIDIVSVNMPSLKYIKNMVGFGRVISIKSRNIKHSDSYHLKFNQNESLRLLSEIKDFLIIKRRNAKLALEYNGFVKGAKHFYDKAYVVKKLKYLSLMKQYNKKGV